MIILFPQLYHNHRLNLQGQTNSASQPPPSTVPPPPSYRTLSYPTRRCHAPLWIRSRPTSPLSSPTPTSSSRRTPARRASGRRRRSPLDERLNSADHHRLQRRRIPLVRYDLLTFHMTSWPLVWPLDLWCDMNFCLKLTILVHKYLLTSASIPETTTASKGGRSLWWDNTSWPLVWPLDLWCDLTFSLKLTIVVYKYVLTTCIDW